MRPSGSGGVPPAPPWPSRPRALQVAPAASAEYENVLRPVTHDLRSPLGAVLNFASVLEHDHGEQLDDEARRLLRRIRRSADSALELLDGLLALAGWRASLCVRRASTSRGWFATPSRACRRRCAARSSRSAIAARDVADPALLRAASPSSSRNAVKFSGRAREGPRRRSAAGASRDGSVVYWVADDGVGFDPRFAGKLFRVFERLHSRDEFPGAGVGLAIVRRVAERHGGRVWAESEPERGARFFLALPAGGEARS